MTWKEEVRTQLIQYREATDTAEFSLQAFYDFAEDDLAEKYPNNNHVRAKIRQVLQQLRDQGEIRFVDESGTYAHADAESEREENDGDVTGVEILEQLESEFENV